MRYEIRICGCSTSSFAMQKPPVKQFVPLFLDVLKGRRAQEVFRREAKADIPRILVCNSSVRQSPGSAAIRFRATDDFFCAAMIYVHPEARLTRVSASCCTCGSNTTDQKRRSLPTYCTSFTSPDLTIFTFRIDIVHE